MFLAPMLLPIHAGFSSGRLGNPLLVGASNYFFGGVRHFRLDRADFAASPQARIGSGWRAGFSKIAFRSW